MDGQLSFPGAPDDWFRMAAEAGFSLLELLVVIVLIGILAAIAIPSFVSQKGKANDVSAKELARTAQTTAATYGTDHRDDYSGLSVTVLQGYEATLPNCPSSNACLVSAAGTNTPSSYTVVTAATSGDQYTISYSGGTALRTCSLAAGAAPTGSGCANGTAAAGSGTW